MKILKTFIAWIRKFLRKIFSQDQELNLTIFNIASGPGSIKPRIHYPRRGTRTRHPATFKTRERKPKKNLTRRGNKKKARNPGLFF